MQLAHQPVPHLLLDNGHLSPAALIGVSHQAFTGDERGGFNRTEGSSSELVVVRNLYSLTNE
jgi:hypothetical protein